MPAHEPQPDLAAAARIARWLGPGMLLLLAAAWGAAWLLPYRDRARFEATQAAGRVELPPAPPPDREPGIDNRALDPSDLNSDQGPTPRNPPPPRPPGAKGRDGPPQQGRGGPPPQGRGGPPQRGEGEPYGQDRHLQREPPEREEGGP